MTTPLQFKGVFPIGDTDVSQLPVAEIEPAIAYYAEKLGFTLVSQNETSATLQRDAATIGLSVNGRDPEQASCYFNVSDVEALHQELTAKGMEPTPLRIDEYGDKRYRVCFAKEPFGVCFCFGSPL